MAEHCHCQELAYLFPSTLAIREQSTPSSAMAIASPPKGVFMRPARLKQIMPDQVELGMDALALPLVQLLG